MSSHPAPTTRRDRNAVIGGSKPNRLAREKSPYLLQHANNPIDWFPWGPEAFSKAREENKPIFLSIGYSTCHWCHVMAHESFENPKTAAVMNERYVNIKVDREERPDVDALYMNATQMLTGGGGWPMSIWLTPDLKPFYAGTYFPPDDRYGRPAFTTIAVELSEIWKNENDRVLHSAGQITDALKEFSVRAKAASDIPVISQAAEKAYAQLSAMHDPVNGGFGRAPKFPMPSYLLFLVDYYERKGEQAALDMATRTLLGMINGGIYDQLGGGFARYSTDEHWTVPHFEKMLYDNSQLVNVLARAERVASSPIFQRALRETVGYVFRQLTDARGGFYSAEDADSEGAEGAFYVWTLAEIKTILGMDTEQFVTHVPVTAAGNFSDPHTGLAGLNVLTRRGPADESIEHILRPLKQKLFDAQSKRPRPHRDDKIITEWNGLMISALVRAAIVMNEPHWHEAAEKAAKFIRTALYDATTGLLFRRWRDGERNIEGLQADYAFFIQALLDLFEANGDPSHLQLALTLQDKHDALFWDISGGYFSTIQRDDLLFQMKDDTDNVTPSGNSIAVLNLFRLATVTGQGRFVERAQKTLIASAKILNSHPASLTSMLGAWAFNKDGGSQIVLVGPAGRNDTEELVQIAQRYRTSGSVLIRVDPLVTQEKLATIAPELRAYSMSEGKATAYVCANFSCRQPTTDPRELKIQLEKRPNG